MDTIFNEIARQMKDDINKTVNQFTLGLELGTITSTGLKVDNFKYVVSDYMVLEYLKTETQYETSSVGIEIHDQGIEYHKHKFNIPYVLRPLAVGDRVLVTTIDNNFLVIGRIANA